MPFAVRRVLSELGIEDLREGGDRLWAPCPYHGTKGGVVVDLQWLDRFRSGREKGTWFVREKGARRGQHHCYSCGRGGTLVDLVMHVIEIGYPTAREWLAQWEGEPEPPSPIPTGISLVFLSPKAFRPPVGVEWNAKLEEWVTPMRRYAERRGITAKQVERWAIGYSLEGRLEGRIVIPIHDAEDDELCSYMARTTEKDLEPRYLTPEARENPDLDAIFGERGWPDFDYREDARLVVCEGALNALACERAGAKYVAAIGGSHVRSLHVAKVGSFGRVSVVTDSDKAGDSAALKLAGAVASRTSVDRIRLPPGKDAAELPEEELRRWLDTGAP